MKRFMLIGLVVVVVSTLLPLTIEAHGKIMIGSILWWVGGEVMPRIEKFYREW